MSAMSELVSVELGLARIAEAPTLARMSREYIERGLGWRWRPPAIRNMILNRDAVVLCARCTHDTDSSALTIGGFGVMQFDFERAHLNLLAVDPSMRRQGIARKLLTWLEKTADVAGLKRITLEVRARNNGARNFYLRLGYEEKEYVPRYYNDRETAMRMVKKLR